MTREGRQLGVLLAEYPLWLEALERVVQTTGVRVVGKAVDAEAALALIREHEPDLLVTEIDAKDAQTEGIECIRRARELVTDLKVVALSARRDVDAVRAALAAGVVAYVLKSAPPEDVASAVRQAFEHSLFVTGDLALAASDGNGTVERAAPDAPGLTAREREILCFVAQGRSNAEVAKTLWVTEQTIKVHLSNVYRKLGVSNRTEAARWAQVHGLLGEVGSQRSAFARRHD